MESKSVLHFILQYVCRKSSLKFLIFSLWKRDYINVTMHWMHTMCHAVVNIAVTRKVIIMLQTSENGREQGEGWNEN